MGVFDQVRDYFRRLPGIPSGTGAVVANEAASAETTAVAEPAILHLADALEHPASGEAAWYRPRGPRTLWQPRVTGESGLVDRDLYEQLSHALGAESISLPRLPSVARRAMQMIRDPNVHFDELAQVMRADAALAGAVLRTAIASAPRGVEIETLECAFTRLGVRAVSSITLACALRDLMSACRGDGALADGLWQRSVASAVTTSRFARRCGVNEGDALLLGLLHDVGCLAIFAFVSDYQKTHGRRVPRLVFDRLCVAWHETVGRRAADEWSLPSPLPEVIADHHGAPADDDRLLRERQIVQLSDCVCALLRYGPYVPYDFFELPCVQALELEEDGEVRGLLDALPDLIEARLACYA